VWSAHGSQQVKILSEGTAVSKPHGGNLVNRFSNIDPSGLSSISISADLANDVENIADGIFSPLEGFLSQQDFENVVEKGKDYYWCRCGRSNKQPFCDGSHKVTSFSPVAYKATETKKMFFCGCKFTSNQPFCDGTHRNI